MKVIANINNEKIREEQFETLSNILKGMENREDLVLFLQSFLSESERAYLGQRLNIMRMLAKSFNYSKIKERIGASGATITNAQKCLDTGGDKLKEIILEYKFKPKPDFQNGSDDLRPFVKSHYPGSIL